MVEILIVIGVLGVLAAVVVFAVGGSTDRSAATACTADSKTLERAEDVFRAQHGRYATEEELVKAGVLRRESNLNDVTLIGDTFTVVSVLKCGTTNPETTAGVAASNTTTAPSSPTSTLGPAPSTTTSTTSTSTTSTSTTSTSTTTTSSTSTTTTTPPTTTATPTTTTNAPSTSTAPTTTATPLVASQLVITVQPTNAPSGASIAPAIVVTVRDAANKFVPDSANIVTLTITAGSGSPAGKLTCSPNSKSAVAGTATFSGCSITKSWTGYRLTASSPGLTSAVSSTFNIT